jgi:hypothetical protein
MMWKGSGMKIGTSDAVEPQPPTKITPATGFHYDGQIYLTEGAAKMARALEKLKRVRDRSGCPFVVGRSYGMSPSDIVDNAGEILAILKEYLE